jgi:phage terminase large subunit
VKIDVSTPNGNGNPFYKKRFGGKIPIFVFDWRDDPRKDEKWYQKQKDILEPWILAQEVDRDYNASVEGICIPSKWVKAAIDYPITPSGSKIAGLDVADEGGDANAYVLRHGVVLTSISSWKEGDTTQTARKAWGLATQDSIGQINFDSIGVGAGVKGEFNSLVDNNGSSFTIHGVNSGSTKLPGMYEGTDKTNKDMFANVKAKMWWSLRRRFEKTYEVLNGIKDHPEEKLISIPNNTELISELSQPLREVNGSGKIIIESKVKMRTRGIPSPNLADACCLAYHEHTGFFEGLV